jgi:hypothetical protein
LGRERLTLSFLIFIMRSQTVICIRWKLSGRIEIFVNLGKVFSNYSTIELGVSRGTLDRRNLFEGYENEMIEMNKSYVR